MTFKGPFQPKLFYDSMKAAIIAFGIICQESVAPELCAHKQLNKVRKTCRVPFKLPFLFSFPSYLFFILIGIQ